MTARFLSAALLALVPLATPAVAQRPAAPAPAPSYRALGTEPFWSLTIDRRMTLDRVGQRALREAAPRARRIPGGTRYAGRLMSVDVVRRACSDGMSDRRYPDTVTVRVGRTTLRGCGGVAAPDAAMLTTGSWTIAAIDGRPPANPARTEVTFADGRMSGSAGCNRFTGSYRIERDRLTAGPLAATRMACPGPAMAQEQRVLAILSRPVTMTTGAEDRVTLTNALGAIALARR